MLLLLILGCLEVIFMSICLYLQASPKIKPNRFLPIDPVDAETYHLANMIVSSLFCLVCLLGLTSLLGEQLKNLTTNTTSFERTKRRKRKNRSLLTQPEDRESINQEELSSQQSMVEDEEEERPDCISSCCSMLKDPYDQE